VQSQCLFQGSDTRFDSGKALHLGSQDAKLSLECIEQIRRRFLLQRYDFATLGALDSTALSERCDGKSCTA
jgi:hypothetical protein